MSRPPFPGFIEATPARGYIVHLVPSNPEATNITTHVARCGWKPKPSGNASAKWYRAGNYNLGHRCPRCFTDAPTDQQEQTP